MIIRRGHIELIDLGFTPDDAVESKKLMGEHFISFSFELDESIPLKKGDNIIYEEESFTLHRDYIPEHKKETNGYTYDLKFYSFVKRLEDYKLKYGKDFDFNLRTTGDKFLDVVISSIPFKTIIKGDFPLDIKTIQFSTVDVYSALNLIAEEYKLEWWFSGNQLNLAKCEFGTQIDLSYDKEIGDINVSESVENRVTRLYAFGLNRNLPLSYGGNLRIPAIDIDPELDESQVIEEVVNFDVYPRQETKIISVEQVVIPATDETIETVYYIIEGDNLLGANPFEVKAEDRLPTKPLKIAFNSGSLTGKEFDLEILGENKYEIKFEEEGTSYLPNETQKPEVGNDFFFFNFDPTNILPALIADAERQLGDLARDYLVRQLGEHVYGVEVRSIEAEKLNLDFEIGQKVCLSSPLMEKINSRIQSYEKKLSNKFEATYQIGESPEYSRLTALEKTTEENTYQLLNSQGITLDQAKSLFVTIGGRNFLSKIADDIALGKITFQQGVEIGVYASGIHTGTGGKIDSAGNAELTSLVLRAFLETPEIRSNRMTLIGDEIAVGSGAVIEEITETENGYRLQLKLEEGEINPFEVRDILKGIFNQKGAFNTSWMSVNAKGSKHIDVLVPDGSKVVGNINFPPKKFMNLARWGNFTNRERQSTIILSARNRSITMYGGVNNYSIKNEFGDNVPAGVITSQWGSAKGLEFIKNFDNLPINKEESVLYASTILYSKLIQVDYKGVPIKEYRDRGAWSKDTAMYDPYIYNETIEDEVWHENSKYRCLVNFTQQTPSIYATDWVRIVVLRLNTTFYAKPDIYIKGDRWILLEDTFLAEIQYKKGQILKAVYETGSDSDWRLVMIEEETKTTDGINLIRNYDLRHGLRHWGNQSEESIGVLEEVLPEEFYKRNYNVLGDEYGYEYAITTENDELIIMDE